MKKRTKNWSVQISNDLRKVLHSYCDANGYKISGFIKTAIIAAISGSAQFTTNK